MTSGPLRMPSTLLILASLIVLAAVASWIVPAGRYERVVVEGVERVDPGSFHPIPRNPQGLGDVMMAPIKGFVDAALIIGFVLMVGGSFGIVQKTGAIDEAIGSVVRMHGRSALARRLLIPLLMVLFSLAGSLFGMSEEVIPFILIIVPMALALGYDTVTGVAIPFLGAGAGFAGAFLNPFTIGVAQGIAGLRLFSGLEYRLVVWVVSTALTVWFVMRYAARVKAHPQLSITYESDLQARSSLQVDLGGGSLDLRHRIVLWVLAASMGILVLGVLRFKWYIHEIAGLFVAMGVVAGIAGGLRPSDIADAFTAGARDLVNTGLVIAFSRGILITAQQGGVVDTLLHGLSSLVKVFHPIAASWAMFLVQTIINFFVPSGSGQAALTMPIMAPLSDLVGVSRQTAVLAFQFGDGYSNMIIPTSAVTMSVLTIAKIPWSIWARWVLKLEIVLFVAGLVMLVPPYFIGWH